MTTTEPSATYRDPRAGVDDRVRDLLGRMSIREKVAQLGSAWIFQLAGADGLDLGRGGHLLADGIGHVTRLSGASNVTARGAAELANDIQQHLRDSTRLGIPAIIHEEICSGLMAREATIYPQALGVAATFRPEYNLAVADTIRAQMRAMGTHHGLSPVLDICRDPRWGRLEETYGEDPYLVSRMGLAFVRGLQGDDLREGVVATAKHLVGYGASEGGMNWAPAHLGERELRDVYLRPFEHAVREGELASVMNGYHEIDGIPCGASEWLFTEVLRGEWGFEGTVVSDYFAVRQLADYHHVAHDGVHAATVALRAGIDVELPGTDCYGDDLVAAVERGLVSSDELDRSVARVLVSKIRLGLFEQPFVDVGAVTAHTRTDDQLDLARRVAADSLVLLKNDGTLPLAAPQTVAVIGPNADSARALLGDYSYIAHVESLVEVLRSGSNVFAMPLDHGADVDAQTSLSHVDTVAGALVRRLPDSAVTCERGCDVLVPDRSGFDAAVAAAAAADIAVVVVGDKAGLTEDSTSGESRDVASLDLPGVQEDLVLAVAATGTPVVAVIVAGRPIGSPRIHEAAAAVLMAWLPGEQGAAAIADALLGTVSPGGKLPVSFPRSVGQVPVFYGHKVSGGRSHWKGAYVDESNNPLYPFGFGLSYSTFEVTAEPLDGPTVGIDDTFTVVATVTNTGGRRADEVVQLYSRDRVASITRPVAELQAFHRATLDPGQSLRVGFVVPVAALGFAGPDMAYVVEPGDIELTIGTSAIDVVPAGHVTIRGDAPIRATRAMSTVVEIHPA